MRKIGNSFKFADAKRFKTTEDYVRRELEAVVKFFEGKLKSSTSTTTEVTGPVDTAANVKLAELEARIAQLENNILASVVETNIIPMVNKQPLTVPHGKFLLVPDGYQNESEFYVEGNLFCV